MPTKVAPIQTAGEEIKFERNTRTFRAFCKKLRKEWWMHVKYEGNPASPLCPNAGEMIEILRSCIHPSDGPDWSKAQSGLGFAGVPLNPDARGPIMPR